MDAVRGIPDRASGVELNGRCGSSSVQHLIIGQMVFRRQLIDLLAGEPRSASSIAREMGLRRGDIEHDLQHAIRSARAAGRRIDVIPARCKDCGFVFGTERLVKPGRCPVCRGSRLYEPMIRIEPGEEER